MVEGRTGDGETGGAILNPVTMLIMANSAAKTHGVFVEVAMQHGGPGTRAQEAR